MSPRLPTAAAIRPLGPWESRWIVRLLTAMVATALCVPAQAREDAFRAELGGFGASYSSLYGNWFGTSARFWLLDSEGTRGDSGYINVVDLYWHPSTAAPLGRTDLHSTFLMLREMHFWTPNLYTMVTLGGTAFDSVFPRLQVEGELNGIVPQQPGMVVTFGGGERAYPGTQRPYLVLGGSYATPKMSASYRYWYGAGITSQRSSTHLITFAYGARLDVWFRMDLLWGDEAHLTGLSSGIDVDSRGMSLTLEKWLTKKWGIIVNPEVTQISVAADPPAVLRRWQMLSRVFYTF
jgi:YaiO family outer membrane protein